MDDARRGGAEVGPGRGKDGERAESEGDDAEREAAQRPVTGHPVGLPAHRPEPPAAGPRTRGATLAVIGLALVAVALTTPVPTAATDAPATAGTGQH